MPTYAVEYTYDDRTVEREHARPDHRSYLRELAAKGYLLGAGAYKEGSPGALLVFRLPDEATLDGLLADDPYARAGLVAGTSIRVWGLALGPWSGQD